MTLGTIYTIQHTATHCNTLQHTATHFNTPQHTTTHCNTLQHIPTHTNEAHCNILHSTTTHASAPHCHTHFQVSNDTHTIFKFLPRTHLREKHVSPRYICRHEHLRFGMLLYTRSDTSRHQGATHNHTHFFQPLTHLCRMHSSTSFVGATSTALFVHQQTAQN